MFVAENFDINNLFNFSEDSTLPYIETFDEQQHINAAAIETMVLYYINIHDSQFLSMLLQRLNDHIIFLILVRRMNQLQKIKYS